MVGPDTAVGANRELLLVPVRLRRKRSVVRVTEQARIALVRIRETELDILSERLRLAAGAVRARAVQRSARVVVVSRERAPGDTLILVHVLPAPGYLTSQSSSGTYREGACTDRHREDGLLRPPHGSPL